MSMSELRIFGIPGIPVITPGVDLTSLISQAATVAALTFQEGDILVVTRKSFPKPRAVSLHSKT
jgi:F420-0:gamma-glutamyl ligase